MHRPLFALVKATLIWCSSVTNPRFCFSHPRLGSCSIWESGKDRTSDMITKSFSLPRGEYMGNEEMSEIASCLLIEGILLLLLHVSVTTIVKHALWLVMTNTYCCRASKQGSRPNPHLDENVGFLPKMHMNFFTGMPCIQCSNVSIPSYPGCFVGFLVSAKVCCISSNTERYSSAKWYSQTPDTRPSWTECGLFKVFNRSQFFSFYDFIWTS